jgi:peptidoglycan/xylan/chitin deacetylase (PgdA/CDA1 family)
MQNRLFDYWPIIRRPPLEWPDGARVAVWVGVNVEHYEPDKPGISIAAATSQLVPDPLNAGWRDYGLRVGLWRLMDVLEGHGIRASVLLNSDVCELYPEVIEEGKRRGWAWLAHGKNNSTLQTNMPLDQERRYLGEVVKTIEQHTGQYPKGWLGPFLSESFNTPNILAELGLTYICDWCNDDQPCPVRVERGKMISIPYSIEVNDIPLFLDKGVSGQDFCQVLVDQFDALYEAGETSGQVMAIALHPFLTGVPFRLRYLDQALAHIAERENVWLTTSDDIADWYLERYYDDVVLNATSAASADRADGRARPRG